MFVVAAGGEPNSNPGCVEQRQPLPAVREHGRFHLDLIRTTADPHVGLLGVIA